MLGGASVIINVKEIFQIALQTNPSGILLYHNHPSGSLKPSKQDIGITKKIRAFAEMMEIRLIDHLILTSEGYCSLADNEDI